MTPFQALYGWPPPTVTTYVPGTSKIADLDELLTQRTHILQLLKDNLTRAHNRMVQQANTKRTDKEFKEGDWVYLKLQSYRQLSLKDRASQTRETILWSLQDPPPHLFGCLRAWFTWGDARTPCLSCFAPQTLLWDSRYSGNYSSFLTTSAPRTSVTRSCRWPSYEEHNLWDRRRMVDSVERPNPGWSDIRVKRQDPKWIPDSQSWGQDCIWPGK